MNSGESSLIKESLDISQKTFDHLILNIDDLDFNITTEKTDKRLMKIIHQVNSLIKLFSLVHQVTDEMVFSKKTIKDAKSQALCIIKAIQSTRARDDFSTLEELLKFELRDTLLMWKVQFLSEMNKVQSQASALTLSLEDS